MKKNMGTADRVIRTVIGLALLSLLLLDGTWRWLGLVGLIPLATAAIGWCPLYAPFKFSTRRER